MSTAPYAVPAPPATVRTVALPAELADRPLLSLLPRGLATTSWVTTDRDGLDTGLVGWGEAARAEFGGAERFSRAQRWWASWLADADVDDEVACPAAARSPSRPSPSTPRPASRSSSCRARSSAAATASRGSPSWPVAARGRHAVDETLAAISHPAAVPEPPAGVAYAEGSLSVPDWQSAVTEAVRRIDDGELDKVVLARDVVVTADAPIDSRHLLARLAARYPSCWTFSVDGLLGSTPEMLVRRIGDTVTSRVLAGTMRRSSNADNDASLASALLDSAKDHAEHEYAVQSVALALRRTAPTSTSR